MKKLLAALGLLGGLWASNVSATILSYDITVSSNNWDGTYPPSSRPNPFGVAEQPTFNGSFQVNNAYLNEGSLVDFNMVTGSKTWTESNASITSFNYDSVGKVASFSLLFQTGSSNMIVTGGTAGGNFMLQGGSTSLAVPNQINCTGCVSFTPTSTPPPSVYQLLRNSISVFDDTGGWTGFTANYDVPTMSSVVNGVPAEGSKGIGATFTPNSGYSLAAAAGALGYDHFNWLQTVYVVGEDPWFDTYDVRDPPPPINRLAGLAAIIIWLIY